MRFAPHPVTLRQLQYVVAVADTLSFRKAAEVCAVSQPALSAQIAQLENVLGLRIFDRDTTYVRPTASGQDFIEAARKLIGLADELVEGARRAADPLAGRLRIGVIPTVGPYLLPEVAVPLREKFPRLSFTWVEERTAVLTQQLREGLLDAAILASEIDAGFDGESVSLGEDPFFLATPRTHPLAREASPVPTDVLVGEHVLVLEDGHCLGDQVKDVCRRARAGDLDVSGTSLATLSQMVVGGVGVTLLPALARDVENRLGTMHLRPFAPTAPGRTLALVWRSGASVEPTLRAIAPVLALPVQEHRARAF